MPHGSHWQDKAIPTKPLMVHKRTLLFIATLHEWLRKRFSPTFRIHFWRFVVNCVTVDLATRSMSFRHNNFSLNFLCSLCITHRVFFRPSRVRSFPKCRRNAITVALTRMWQQSRYTFLINPCNKRQNNLHRFVQNFITEGWLKLSM